MRGGYRLPPISPAPFSLYCQNVNTKWVIYIDEINNCVIQPPVQSKASKLRELRKTMNDIREMIADLKGKKLAIKAQIKAVKGC